MHKIITSIIVVALSLFGESIKVKKVLDVTDTESYNLWIVAQQGNLQHLKPILIDLAPRNISDDTMNAAYKIQYYSSTGILRKEEIIEDMNVYFYEPKTMDRIIISHSQYKHGSDYYEVKNSQGEVLFTPEVFVHYVGMGMYVESHVFEGVIPEDIDTKIMDDNGNQIGVIDDLASIDPSRFEVAFDESYAVFRGLVKHALPVICLNQNGSVRWRKDFEPPATKLFISDDGARIGIHHGNLISVLNEDGDLISSFNPFGSERALKCVLSPEGEFLAVSNISPNTKLVFFSVKTGEIVWKGEKILSMGNQVIKSLHIDINKRLIVLCKSGYMYIFDNNGEIKYEKNLKLNAKIWFSDLDGQYLILTIGRASIFDIYRQVQRRIIYKIID